jgi:hypothetical protein
MEPDLEIGWIARTPFERCMDDIAAAQSTSDIDDLRREVWRHLASHPRVRELERMLDVKQRLRTERDTNAANPGDREAGTTEPGTP